MKKFLIRLILFVALCYGMGELIVRAYKMVPDIPKRFVDDSGIQRYVPGQSGYYTKATAKWKVNEYGWLGISETKYDTLLSIIGDSYIENLMNPDSCNQGYILKLYNKNYGFFEAGRSGVSFIEAMEITKLLDSTINPSLHLVYVAKSDFEESFSSVNRFTDRIQIDLKKKEILKSKLKSSFLKNLLYANKMAYYLYLRFPVFVSKQNKGENSLSKQETESISVKSYDSIFQYSNEHYNVDNIILIFHPDTEMAIISMAKQFGFKTILLKINNGKSWALGSHDGHWSCYGHNEAAKQINSHLKSYL